MGTVFPQIAPWHGKPKNLQGGSDRALETTFQDFCRNSPGPRPAQEKIYRTLKTSR